MGADNRRRFRARASAARRRARGIRRSDDRACPNRSVRASSRRVDGEGRKRSPPSSIERRLAWRMRGWCCRHAFYHPGWRSNPRFSRLTSRARTSTRLLSRPRAARRAHQPRRRAHDGTTPCVPLNADDRGIRRGISTRTSPISGCATLRARRAVDRGGLPGAELRKACGARGTSMDSVWGTRVELCGRDRERGNATDADRERGSIAARGPGAAVTAR